MNLDLGTAQAAIWFTEEAIDLHRQQIERETDPRLNEIARRSLDSLESLLEVQRRTLDVLIQQRAWAPPPARDPAVHVQ